MRALLSVYDKTGIIEFARGLAELGWELCATDGTRAALESAGLAVMTMAALTGGSGVGGGRVATLHPRVHGALLLRRDIAGDMLQAAADGIEPIDMVVGNFTPFLQTVTAAIAPSVEEAVEAIDVGGPALMRSAARNHRWVIPVVDPADYEPVLAALQSGEVDTARRRALAAKAVQHVALYDTVVAEYLRGENDLFPPQLTVGLTRAGEQLRYGENPHQRAALYAVHSVRTPVDGIATYEQHHGIALSYTNILDADAALSLVATQAQPAIAVIKHTNPCCFATADEPLDVLYERALTLGDAVAAYGGVVACNRTIDVAAAAALRARLSPVEGVRMLYELLIAPDYDADALELLRETSGEMRILSAPFAGHAHAGLALRSVRGGVVAQDIDTSREAAFRVTSRRAPTAHELADLQVAWAVCRSLRSNAIALVRDGVLVGVGAGQPSRLESARQAVAAAREQAQGAALASDAFFPFPEALELAVAAGVTAAVHPGGSLRDADAIEVADMHGVALCESGVRHLRH